MSTLIKIGATTYDAASTVDDLIAIQPIPNVVIE